MGVRVRFAPSPTGYLHIGGARTALTNYLFAKRQGGSFLLRIEDTDLERSSEEMTKKILDGLKWLGLKWEGEPVVQSSRKQLYQNRLGQLKEKGVLYPCFCAPEELAARRKEAQKKGLAPKYDGRCRDLSEKEKNQFEKEGRCSALRFRTPEEGEMVVCDEIRGRVKFENNLLGDFVVAKSDGGPTYNFAVVVDDHEMKITHVIRGEDHLSNSPRQLHLYRAFGWEPPRFAHLPMIHGTDGARLSKRHGAASIEEYRKKGYLPEALANYLALLGWSPSEEDRPASAKASAGREIFTLEELAQAFSLERCKKSSAIFDQEKLLWMNGEYIRALSRQEFIRQASPFLKGEGLDPEAEGVRRAMALEQEKTKLLTEIGGLIRFLIIDEIEYEPEAIEKILRKNGVREHLDELTGTLEKTEPFTEQETEKAVRDYCKKKGVKTSQVFHPLRVSVSGRSIGPSLFAILSFLGREKVLKRIQETIRLL